MKKLYLVITILFVISIYSFDLHLYNSVTCQRVDGSQIFDIYLLASDVPDDGLVLFWNAIVVDEHERIIDTLGMRRFSSESDASSIYSDGVKHIEWLMGEEYPDYEFKNKKLFISIVASTTGLPPYICNYDKYVDGGGDHILVNQSLRYIHGCGWNRDGQVGDGTNFNRNLLSQTLESSGTDFIEDIIDIGANGGGSYGHSIALKSDASVWCWGKNHHGELGDGSHTDSNRPVRVIASTGGGYFEDAIDVECGGYHNLILKNDGTVWAFGHGTFGQLGNRASSNSSRPVQVVHSDSEPLTNIIDIACGFWYSLAVDIDGQVWAWGWNSFGELGTGTGTSVSYAVRVLDADSSSLLDEVVSVEAGCFVSMFEKDDGRILVCGSNRYGQLGLGYTGGTLNVPTYLLDEFGEPLVGVLDFDSGEFHTIILRLDGTVWTCGLGENGQLGNGSFSSSSSLVQTRDELGTGYLSNIIDVTCNLRASYAVDAYGNIWSFGNNNRGQLGVGSTTSANLPARMMNPDGVTYFEAF